MPSSAWKTDVCSRSEEHTSELQSLTNLVCRLLLEKPAVCRSRYVPLRRRKQAERVAGVAGSLLGQRHFSGHGLGSGHLSVFTRVHHSRRFFPFPRPIIEAA